MFYNIPKFALSLWFTYFLSSVAASAVAIVVTVWALAEYIEFLWGSSSIELELFNHLGLWALVALGGILIALINLRTEPLVARANITRKELASASKFLGHFEGVALYEIDFPVPLAFTARIHGNAGILISKSASQALSNEELVALYWHELGHIRGRHNLIQSITRLIALFTPILAASKLFAAEAEHLTEIIADNYAKKHVDSESLAAAREKFLE
jgi:Zn-dependent protease with chaperone function